MNWVATFYKEYYFYKEDWHSKIMAFRLGHVADIFSKMNEVILSLWGKQVKIFAANDKIQAFK